MFLLTKLIIMLQCEPYTRKISLKTTRNMIKRLRSIYQEYPRIFWFVMLGMFIDQLGGALIYPFFGLYITSKYNVGMTEVGVLFSIFAITGLVGSLIGGAVTDKFGRKGIILFSLVISAASTLLFAFAPSLRFIYLAGFVIGFFGSMAGPAHRAMVADILPEEQRIDGFGVLRVIANLAVAIGPAIGGFVAARSYTLLFIIDIILSSITAVILFFMVPETKPEIEPSQELEERSEQTMVETLSGYFIVFKDNIFMVYLLASVFYVMAYMQMNTSLPVFLRDVHGLPDSGYGIILSINASMVVLFQFWITRRIKRFAPMKLMAWGMVVYAFGFSMYGYVGVFWLFVTAMVIITIAEMLVTPTGQAIVAKLSPEDMRGRYMAVFGFSWTIPNAIGPLAAGLIMDHYNPRLVWYGAGIFMLLAASVFASLQLKASDRFVGLNGEDPSPEPQAAVS
jgi:MFS family permease